MFAATLHQNLQGFHFITTKPIAIQRTRAQDESKVTEWFEKYFRFIWDRVKGKPKMEGGWYLVGN